MRPQKKANLFLVGAAKSGTTTLAHYLQQHPDIAGLAIKEPGHFCTDLHQYPFSTRYQQLLQWDEAAYFSRPPVERHVAFVHSRDHYQQLVQHSADARYVLDASTAYLYSTEAASQVQAYAPDAKILVVLRNPSGRAYSHYTMAAKYGMELRPALQAFREEAALTRARWGVRSEE